MACSSLRTPPSRWMPVSDMRYPAFQQARHSPGKDQPNSLTFSPSLCLTPNWRDTFELCWHTTAPQTGHQKGRQEEECHRNQWLPVARNDHPSIHP